MKATRSIIAIRESDGERRGFSSINEAAGALGTNFYNIQRTAMSNGTYKGWRIYESPDAIRQHIKDLEAQLKVLEG